MQAVHYYLCCESWVPYEKWGRVKRSAAIPGDFQKYSDKHARDWEGCPECKASEPLIDYRKFRIVINGKPWKEF